MSTPGKPARSGDNLAATVRTGLAFTGGADAVRQVVELGTSIVLARLLLPADFGIVAVVGSFLQISYTVGNLGMGSAVIQAESLSKRDCDVAYTFSTMIGVMLMVCGIALAPLAAGFFRMPSLEQIMPLMSVQLLISSMSAIPVGLLRRELRFGSHAMIETSSALIYGAVGVGLAVQGYGVWSLAWAPLASSGYLLVMSTIATGFVPRPSLARESRDKLLGFGSGVTFKNIFVYIGRNADNLIVARMLGGTATGLYTRAFNFTRLPQFRLVGIIYRVCFPAFCKLRSDRRRFHDWYLKATTVVAVSVTPILLGLCVLAEDFTIAVLGPHWAEMAMTLRLLSISGLVTCLYTLAGAAIEATGRIRYEVATQALYALVIVAGCIAFAGRGIEAVAIVVLSASLCLYLLKGLTLQAATGLSIARFLGATLPSVTAGLAMCAAGVVYLDVVPDMVGLGEHHWFRLLTGTAVCSIAYIAALGLVGRSQLALVMSQGAQVITGMRRPRVQSEPSTV